LTKIFIKIRNEQNVLLFKLPIKLLILLQDVGDRGVLHAEEKIMKFLENNDEMFQIEMNFTHLTYKKVKHFLKIIFSRLKKITSPVKNFDRYCGLISLMNGKNIFLIYIIDINLLEKTFVLKMDEIQHRIDNLLAQGILKLMKEIKNCLKSY